MSYTGSFLGIGMTLAAPFMCRYLGLNDQSIKGVVSFTEKFLSNQLFQLHIQSGSAFSFQYTIFIDRRLDSS